jgi:hypothetical protein
MPNIGTGRNKSRNCTACGGSAKAGEIIDFSPIDNPRILKISNGYGNGRQRGNGFVYLAKRKTWETFEANTGCHTLFQSLKLNS